MIPEEKQNFQKFQKIIAWRRQALLMRVDCYPMQQVLPLKGSQEAYNTTRQCTWLM